MVEMRRKYLSSDGLILEVLEDQFAPGEFMVFRHLPGGGLYRVPEAAKSRDNRDAVQAELDAWAGLKGLKEITADGDFDFIPPCWPIDCR